MKKVYLAIIYSSLLLGCSINHSTLEDEKEVIKTENTELSFPVSSYLNEHEDMRQVSENGGINTVEVEFSTMEEYAEKADMIILGSITSLDGAETILGENMQSVLGFTLGTLFVQETYKGNSRNGEIIKYLKNGGVISMAQQDAAYDLESFQKRGQIEEDTKNYKSVSDVYINTTLEQDIQVEEGKTYLLSLDYIEELDRYLMIGYNEMNREANLPKVQNVSCIDVDLSNIKLKSYEAAGYEDLTFVLAEMKIK